MVDIRTTSGKKTARGAGSPRAGRSGRGALRASPARRGTVRLAVVLVALVFVNFYVFLWRDQTSVPAVMRKAEALEPGSAGQPPGTSASERGDLDQDDDGVVVGEPVVPGVDGDVAPAPDGVIEGEVAKGDTLGKVLRGAGLSAAEADEVLRAMSGVFDFKTLRPGQAFRVERDARGQVAAFELTVSKTTTVRVERDARGELVGAEDRIETRVEVAEVGGRIDSSLYAALKASGEQTSLVAFFVDVFAYDLDFYVDTHKGDEFRVLVEKEYVGAELLRYKRILAAEYKGKAGTFRAFWFDPDGAGKAKGRYFDEKGRSVEKSLLKTPLKFTRISSKFNPRRMHPVLHKVRGHFGVDYAAPTGTPVWAAANGVITTRGFKGGPGNHVVIKHDNGLTTAYFHLSKFAPGQKVGQRIEAKTVIGYVGSTGLSTGPHLHFSVKKNGAHVDPLSLEPQRAGGVAKKDQGAYRAEVDRMTGRLAQIAIPAPGAAAAAPDGDDADEAGALGADEAGDEVSAPQD